MAEFAKLIGDADLAVSRLVQRKANEDGLDLGRSAVLQDRLSPRQFLQRPSSSAPSLGSCLSYDTDCRIKS